MLAARMMQTFEFSTFSIAQKLSFQDPDFGLRGPARAEAAKVIDLDGSWVNILHPGNKSNRGLPGMTAANVPLYDFICELTPRGSELLQRQRNETGPGDRTKSRS